MLRSLLALAIALVLIPSVARAQSASYGQYLVVLDDSGSMDGSDPRRLAPLAALALAAALEDGDQVMLVGLNELASGAITSPRFVSPRELLPERAQEGARPIAGDRVQRLEQHQGQTPCRAALEAARALLEPAASAGAPQTLLMLTDGACNGGAVEPAERWLASLRAHREGRFRFVLLMRQGPERIDRTLESYGRHTGWQGDTRVAFDARSLLRAFADVLSFSRGLRYDEGGRVGLERTFAGARAVRVLAIRDRGEGPIALEQVEREGRAVVIPGGATYREPAHEWSFRSTTIAPREQPFAVRSASTGVDVLVIPVYGRLRVEAVVAPCEHERPSFDAEIAVRAGQPACAFARLVGDTGETIVPARSFDFGIELCETSECTSPSPMQPGDDGVFHAQLGAELARGRHERTFRARGGALAAPVIATRGFAAMSFGVQRVTRDERAVSSIDLGELPRAVSEDLTLRYEGSFPAGTRARVRCEVEGAEALASCVECALPEGDTVSLQDAFTIHATVRGRAFCPRASEGDAAPRPIRMRLVVEPEASDQVGAHSLPIDATLRYAAVPPLAMELTAGETIEHEVRVPGPVAESAVDVHVEGAGDDIEAAAVTPHAQLGAGEDRMVAITLRASASDCCGAGPRDATLVLVADDRSELRVPLRIEVRPPSFWTCPGKQIAMAIAALLALVFVIWLVHGVVSPARFDPGALLLSASSHDELLSMREGDDGWRHLRRFTEAQRGFRRPAAVWLGGPRAPLPSLKRQPADGRIEAQPGGGASLVVTGPGIERWNDAESRYVEIERGTHPVPSRVRIKRGEELFLEFRR
ncbi:VWA domain-containing protein [Sandaracinus amylolyticus]|uniref:VWA domain-containing protein n=1 Tax=Sandaracinus amylolyticus TaxID=927083 RepID=UPI001F2AF439|nr:VWA domain-containing protein [Sandaracinus amylolyticus]